MTNNWHQALKKHLLQAIAEAQTPRDMTTKIVAIDGGGGAGKTTLAQLISGWLGGAPMIVTDDFDSWGSPLDSCPRLLEQVLEPLGRNQPAHYQRYDWTSFELAEWHDIQPGGTVILEGVSSLRREFRPYLTYRIWVETSSDLRLKRGLVRDRGIPGEDTPEQWQEWQAFEREHFQTDQPNADLIIEAETEQYEFRPPQPGELLR